MDYGQILMYFGGLVLVLALYVLIVRWVFRVDDIVSYLSQINEKLTRLEAEKDKKDRI